MSLGELSRNISLVPIKVPILGSYDQITLSLMRRLIDDIKSNYDPEYEGNVFALLASDLRLFVSRAGNHTYAIITEECKKQGSREDTFTLSIFKDGAQIEAFDVKNKDELNQKMQKIEYEMSSNGFREAPTTEKVTRMFRWADLMPIVKEQELTRGGELIELAMLFCLELFRNENHLRKRLTYWLGQEWGLSWMAQEIVQLGKAKNAQEYGNFDELYQIIKKGLDNELARRGIVSSS
jgi:hypothetical protein